MRSHYARLTERPGSEPQGPLAQPRLLISESEVNTTLRKFNVSKPYCVLCPGAEYGPAKRWPYFRELSSKLSSPVLILGSSSDENAYAGILGKNLIGRTTLEEAMALIAGAHFVVTNDSGLMHVAAALGRPQVALFGSSSPEHKIGRASCRERV